MRGLKPADLAVFLAIASHRSFRKAAAELGVTPSALSHALRGIEERLGLRLINRTTRSVALTEAGIRLYARVSPAFRDIEDALEDLNSFRERPAGTLRINAPRSACALVLLPILDRFIAAYPDIRIELGADEAFVDIVAAGYDMGVRFGETIAADMIALPLGPKLRYAVVGSPEFFERYRKPQHPRDLAEFPCIGYRFLSGTTYDWEFAKDGAEVSVAVDGPLAMNDLGLMLQAALGGTCLAYVLEELAAELIAQGRLIRVMDDWCPAYPGYFLYYPSRRQLPAPLRAFIDFTKPQMWGA